MADYSDVRMSDHDDEGAIEKCPSCYGIGHYSRRRLPAVNRWGDVLENAGEPCTDPFHDHTTTLDCWCTPYRDDAEPLVIVHRGLGLS